MSSRRFGVRLRAAEGNDGDVVIGVSPLQFRQRVIDRAGHRNTASMSPPHSDIVSFLLGMFSPFVIRQITSV